MHKIEQAYHNTVVIAIKSFDDMFDDKTEQAYALMAALGLTTMTEVPLKARNEVYTKIIDAVQKDAEMLKLLPQLPWLMNGLRSLRSLRSGAYSLDGQPFHCTVVTFIQMLTMTGNPVYDAGHSGVGLRFVSTMLHTLETEVPAGQHRATITRAYRLASVQIFGEDDELPSWVTDTQFYLDSWIGDGETRIAPPAETTGPDGKVSTDLGIDAGILVGAAPVEQDPDADSAADQGSDEDTTIEEVGGEAPPIVVGGEVTDSDDKVPVGTEPDNPLVIKPGAATIAAKQGPDTERVGT